MNKRKETDKAKKSWGGGREADVHFLFFLFFFIHACFLSGLNFFLFSPPEIEASHQCVRLTVRNNRNSAARRGGGVGEGGGQTHTYCKYTTKQSCTTEMKITELESGREGRVSSSPTGWIEEREG